MLKKKSSEKTCPLTLITNIQLFKCSTFITICVTMWKMPTTVQSYSWWHEFPNDSHEHFYIFFTFGLALLVCWVHSSSIDLAESHPFFTFWCARCTGITNYCLLIFHPWYLLVTTWLQLGMIETDNCNFNGAAKKVATIEVDQERIVSFARFWNRSRKPFRNSESFRLDLNRNRKTWTDLNFWGSG